MSNQEILGFGSCGSKRFTNWWDKQCKKATGESQTHVTERIRQSREYGVRCNQGSEGKEKAEKAAQFAERKADKQRQKQTNNAAKSIQLSQRGPRKALQQQVSKRTKKRGAVDAAGGPSTALRSPDLPPKFNSRGCRFKRIRKFE